MNKVAVPKRVRDFLVTVSKLDMEGNTCARVCGKIWEPNRWCDLRGWTTLYTAEEEKILCVFGKFNVVVTLFHLQVW